MDIRSLYAAQKYASTRNATAAAPKETLAADMFVQAAQGFQSTLKNAETLGQAAMMGQADPHALVHALAQSELAVETAVTLRNKVVEAYQEILRMPV